MLYPIELLRHCVASTPIGASEDGVHVNGMEGFCHVVIAFDNRSPHPGAEPLQAGSCILHYPKKPSLQNAISSALKSNITHCFIRIFY